MSSNVNPKKRSAAAKAGDRSSDESDDSCSENGYSGDEEQSSAEDDIQIDVEGQAITEREATSIEWFLRELLPEGRINLALAAQEITAQKGIGSVVKCESSKSIEDGDEQDSGGGDEDEEEREKESDTLGVTTVLDLSGLRDNDLSKQIISFLQEQANKSGKGQELSKLMSSRKTYLGWLVHERFPSIPTKIAPYLLRNLPAELKAASAKKHHGLTHFVVITKAYDTASPPKQSSTCKGAAKKPHMDTSIHDLVYEYPEMELFAKEAPMSFMWGVKLTGGGGSEVEDDTATVKPKRVALLFPAKTFELLVSTLEEALERL